MTMNAMPRIDRASLMTLETYARERPQFRAKVIAHKKHRTGHLGEHVTLIFEDELTIRYQVQEMLRIERIFEEEGIREELAAYNPLVPDGRNLKATMMIEYPDPDERSKRLADLMDLRGRRHPGGTRCLQPARSGRPQSQGDHDDRVPGSGRTQQAACGSDRYRGQGVAPGRGSRAGPGDCRRGSRSGERAENLCGAFFALRARRGNGPGAKKGR